MISRNSLTLLYKSILVLSVFSLLVFWSSSIAKPNTKLSIIQESPDGERKIQVSHYRNMPAETTLAVTAIKNLQSENWLQELEIEVQNNSYKPIYFLQIGLRFPDIPRRQVLGALRGYVIPLEYGRITLMKWGEFATSEDVPINPGEKYVFKISEPQWKGLEHSLTERNISKSIIKKVNINIYRLSYGDGTGFRMGAPFSYNRNSRNNSSPRDRPLTGLIKVSTSANSPPVGSRNFTLYLKKSASYKANTASPPFERCGPAGSNCSLYEEQLSDCPNDIVGPVCGHNLFYSGTSSSNPNAICIGWFNYDTNDCMYEGVPYTCTFDTYIERVA